MKADEAARFADTTPFREFAQKALEHDPHGAGHHSGALESIRRAEHKGHRIVIKTTYEITVDGKPLATHVHVTNDGKLHSHALPNYVFASAVDLIRTIVDLFPGEFPSGDHGADHGGHTHEHR